MRALVSKIIESYKLYSKTPTKSPFPFGPINYFTQKRWKKPANTAQTRLENRTLDPKLDTLTAHIRKLSIALHLFDLMSKRKSPFVSLQIMSRWANMVGLNVSVCDFLRQYPHVFEIFTHSVKRNVCCRVSSRMMGLIEKEEFFVVECELENVRNIKKLLMMSKNGTLHLHALRLVSRELGLPKDFRESILRKYERDFRLVDAEVVGLVERDDCLGVAEVEKWREKEFSEKWLSEFETKYKFSIDFPTGFKIVGGFRDELKNWQRMAYVKPYEKEVTRSRTAGGIERFEKRVVGILHEFLSLTVEKMINFGRLAHFRKDLGIEVNLRELLLKHPGIFYVSTKGNTQTVFLREAYSKGCLIEPNPICSVRMEMMDLMLLGRRSTTELQLEKVSKVEKRNPVTNMSEEGTREGDWVIPLLEGSGG